MNKLGARRLLRLADILDKADAEHRKRREPRYAQSMYTHSCGTPACAWGHYAISSRSVMRRLGFRVADDIGRFNHVNGLSFQSLPQKEFEISSDDDLDLFSMNGCGGAKTAKQAARYIRSFVKRKQAEAT